MPAGRFSEPPLNLLLTFSRRGFLGTIRSGGAVHEASHGPATRRPAARAVRPTPRRRRPARADHGTEYFPALPEPRRGMGAAPVPAQSRHVPPDHPPLLSRLRLPLGRRSLARMEVPGGPRTVARRRRPPRRRADVPAPPPLEARLLL